MRRVLLAAGAVLALAAAPAHAATVTDAVGDLLPTYVGPQTGDMDVISLSVVFDDVADAFRLTAAMAGDIDQDDAVGIYAIGVDTGTGPIAPFADIGAPNVRFNQVVGVRKSGAAFVGANPLTALVFGNVFTVVVPLALLPSTGFAPDDYGFNIWPRFGLGNNNQISDFAPDDGVFAASVPEPATWALMIGGFAFAGGMLRRRRHLRAAVPV